MQKNRTADVCARIGQLLGSCGKTTGLHLQTMHGSFERQGFEPK